MADQKKIIINTELKTTLSGMDKVISDLEKGLSKQKFDIGKTSNLSKLIKEYKNAAEELEGFMEGGQVSSNNTKKFVAQGEKIGKLYRQIGEAFKQIQDGSFDTLKKFFPSNFNAQIEKGTKAISDFFGKIETKNIKQSKLDLLNKDVTSLNSELEELRGRRVKIEIEADKKKVQNDLDEVARRATELQDKLRLRLIPEEAKNSKGQTRTTVLEQELAKRKKSYDTAKDLLENLRVEQLSKVQVKKIAGLEGQLRGSEGEDLLAIETKRLKDLRAEKSARATIAQVPGAQDRGRNARTYGKVTDKELDAQITASRNRLKQLNDIAQQIEDIRIEPQKAYEAAKAAAETAVKRAKTNLDKTDQELKAHRESRQILEAEAEAKASNFMAGQDIAEATDAERQALADLNDERERARKELEALNKEKSFRDQDSKDKSVQSKEHDLAQKQIQIQKITSEIASLNVDTDINKIFDKLEELNIPVKGIERSAEGLRELQNELTNLNSTTVEKIKEDLIKLDYSGEKAEKVVHDLGVALNRVELDDENLRRSAQEIDNLKNQVLDFFSLTNSVEIFKDVVRSAVDTIKELDAVMTETAVVTDFSISDMWSKLPQYATEASSLGTSIADLYGATTLYYQQGLNSQQAMTVGIETMKMARIANIDATEATTAMTAALRGFNMEVNELNAQKVNDVYSELAAITAADTSQIATAMSKTASIAASANMEFETTAAFLAQIIETTQEAPETAGTALKTIIARFTEVKELFSEGQLVGTDTEGEEIDINKIDAALRTVGISLKDFLRGEEGMDDILLELASKWNTLDLATQRYIATTAAGSRQQSRFLAMMGDYGRTMELVGAANNSAGASQKQFEKTLESLDAKLQQLTNAWDTFAMGLADDQTVKLLVTALTGLLNALNGIIGAVSGENGLIKSLTSLGVAYGGLKIGKGVFEALFDSIKDVSKESGKDSGMAFSTAFGQNLKTRMGKTGNVFKKYLPNKKAWEELIGGDLEDTLTGMDFSGFSRSMKEKLKKSILEQYKHLGGEKIEIPVDFDETFLKNPAQGVELLNNKLGQTGSKLRVTGDIAKSATATLEQGFAKAAGAAAGLATVLNVTTTILNNTGHERAAEGFEALTTGATVLTGALMVLPKILAVFGTNAMALAGPIGVVISAIAGLISVAVALEKWIENDAEKLERLGKEATEAAEAANEAKEAYESLADSADNYDTLQKELEELTRGTEEWRQKLIEVNNEVLKLLDTYPELAQYLERGEEGQLGLQEGALENLLKNQGIAAQNSSDLAILKQGAILVEENRQLTKRLNSHSDYDDAERAFGSQPRQYAGEYVRGLVESTNDKKQAEARLIFANSSALFGRWEGNYESFKHAVMEEGAKLPETISLDFYEKVSKEVAGLRNQREANNLQLEGLYGSLLSPTENATEDQKELFNSLIYGLSTSAGEYISEKAFGKMGTYESKDASKIISDYERRFGAGSSEGKKTTEMIDDLSQMDVVEDLETVFNDFISNLEGIDLAEDSKEELHRLFSFDAGQVTGGTKAFEEAKVQEIFRQMGYLNGDEPTEALKNLAEVYGIDATNLSTILKGFADKMSAIVKTGQSEIDQSFRHLMKITKHVEGAYYMTDDSGEVTYVSSLPSQLSTLTNEQLQGYTNAALQAYGLGDDDGKAIMEIIDGLLERASDPSKKQGLLNLLATEDFQKTGSAERFVESLEALGFSFEGVGGGADDFIDKLDKIAKGFKKVDAEKTMDSVSALLGLRDEAADGKKTFSQDQYDALISAGVADKEDFLWTGQEWAYVGTEDIVTAINEGVDRLIDNDSSEVASQIEDAEEMNRLLGEFASGDSGTYSFSKEEFSSGSLGFDEIAGIKTLMGADSSESDAKVYAKYQRLAAAYSAWGTNLDNEEVLTTKGADAQAYNQSYLVTQNKDVLAAKAEELGVTNDTIERYKGLLEDTARKEEDWGRAATIAAMNQKNFEKAIQNTSDALPGLLEELNKTASGTNSHFSAFEKIISEFEKQFGASLDANKLYEDGTFVELLQEWIEGDESAWPQIMETLSSSAEETLKEIVTQAKGDFTEFSQEISSLTFDVNGTANFDSGSFLKNLIIAKDQVDEFVAAMALLNLNVTMKETDGGFSILTMSLLDGYNPFRTTSSGGGGSSSKWENPYDKLYNTVQRINAELRLRERLEREYQRLLDNSVISSAELAKNSREQIASLEYEKKTREYLLEKRREEMALLGSEFSDVAHYASWDENIGVMLNQEALAKLDGSTNEKLTSKVEKYISKMEEKADQIYEEANAIDEIEDTVKEIQEQGKDEYIDFENQVKDALIFEREQEIEKLTEINETINDSNSKLISAMQESINKERQTRENSKTEEELEQKRQRLAQLQMDTSGANALEILALEKEIAEQEQGYIDTLVDQKIQALQDQNEKAYNQRAEQIEIMNTQLELFKNSRAIWDKVNEVMSAGFNPETGIINGSKLEEVLQNEANFSGLSAIGQQEWWKDLTETLTAAFGYAEVNQQLEDIGATAGEKINFKYGNEELSGTINKDGSVTTDDGRVFNNVYKGFGGYYAGENYDENSKTVIEEPVYESDSSQNRENGDINNQGHTAQEVAQIQARLNALGYDAGTVDGLYGSKTQHAVKTFKAEHLPSDNSDKITEAFLNMLADAYRAKITSFEKTRHFDTFKQQKAFATGGLADFTGPAWLDGTKAKPEYVLSATQTERFFTLVDILDSWKDLNKDKNIQNNGDNIVDIDINIETVKEEADVDMLAEKVQQAIVTSARYRNNSFVQR